MKAIIVLPYIASVDQKLVTQLACLHCGRTQSKHFPWEENQREILWKAIHHADEQVICFVIIAYCIYCTGYIAKLLSSVVEGGMYIHNCEFGVLPHRSASQPWACCVRVTTP